MLRINSVRINCDYRGYLVWCFNHIGDLRVRRIGNDYHPERNEFKRLGELPIGYKLVVENRIIKTG